MMIALFYLSGSLVSASIASMAIEDADPALMRKALSFVVALMWPLFVVMLAMGTFRKKILKDEVAHETL